MNETQSVIQQAMSNRLVRQPVILSDSYTPPRLVGRNPHLRELSAALWGAITGGDQAAVHVHGPEGSGKTTLVRAFLGANRHLCASVIIDLTKCDTAYRALANLANHLTPKLEDRVPFTGWPLSDVVDRVRVAIGAQERPVVVVLDMLQVLDARHATAVLAALRPTKASLVVITRDDTLGNLPPDVQVHATPLEVPPFLPQHVGMILRDRVDAAIEPGALDPRAYTRILAIGNPPQHDSFTAVLRLLRGAIETATRRGAPQVTEQMVNEAYDALRKNAIVQAVERLDESTRGCLDAVVIASRENNGETVTGDAYREYEKLAEEGKIPAKLTQRRFTDLVTMLHDAGLVTARVQSLGRYGRTKLIRPHEALLNPGSVTA